eukprot:359793-Chlamydomonas_euryale.AAC.16
MSSLINISLGNGEEYNARPHGYNGVDAAEQREWRRICLNHWEWNLEQASRILMLAGPVPSGNAGAAEQRRHRHLVGRVTDERLRTPQSCKFDPP